MFAINNESIIIVGSLGQFDNVAQFNNGTWSITSLFSSSTLYGASYFPSLQGSVMIFGSFSEIDNIQYNGVAICNPIGVCTTAGNGKHGMHMTLCRILQVVYNPKQLVHNEYHRVQRYNLRFSGELHYR